MSNSPQPSRQNNWLSTLVVALAVSLGIPTAIIAVSTHFVNDHPWLALLITLAFGVVVFIVYVIVKVWLKLESRWVDIMAEWLDHRVQSLTSRYLNKYCQYLGFQHRDFDVKGLSLQGPYTLELNQVFVELSIDPTTIQLMSANPITVPQTLWEGNHSIWDYLTSTPLANQHLAIIGPPGSGKTTLLKHITLALLAHRNPRHPRTRILHKIPIMLFLRDHVGAIHESASKDIPDFTLVDALHSHLKRWEQPEPPAGWVKRQLQRGRCLVMLDGLDEVADPQIRGEVVSWVQMQIVVYGQNRFIITSRPFGFRSNPLTRVAVLEVRSFTSEQVEQFIQKWYLADEIMRKQKDDTGVRMRARAEARELLQQLYNTPALLDLTVNPLLLTMIAIVHRYGGGGKLPEKRIALYSDICRVFLGKRQEARGQELELKPDQLQLVLQPLAYYMMQQGIRDITPEQAKPIIEGPLESVSSQISAEAFLKLVENVSGLLLERENGVYSYAHLTFQEFLAAVHIREKQLGSQLVALVGHSWWQETIRLYCAMTDATSIINACLAGDRPSMSALLLALDCQKEARELRPEVRIRLETIVNQGIEDTDPERQHLAAEVMLTRRLHQLVRLKGEIYIDTSFVTCAEYQAFLDEQATQGRYLQPDHWTFSRFSSGQGNKPVLGIRSSDAQAFCTWLTERGSSPWRYRLPRAGELEGEWVSSRLSAGTGYWLEDGKEFVWSREVPTLPGNILQEIANHSLFRIRASKLTHQKPIDLDSVIVRLLELERLLLHDGQFHFQSQEELLLQYERDIQYLLHLQRELQGRFHSLFNHQMQFQRQEDLLRHFQNDLQYTLQRQEDLLRQEQANFQKNHQLQHDLQDILQQWEKLNFQHKKQLEYEHELQVHLQHELQVQLRLQEDFQRLLQHHFQLQKNLQRTLRHTLRLQHQDDLQHLLQLLSQYQHSLNVILQNQRNYQQKEDLPRRFHNDLLAQVTTLVYFLQKLQHQDDITVDFHHQFLEEVQKNLHNQSHLQKASLDQLVNQRNFQLQLQHDLQRQLQWQEDIQHLLQPHLQHELQHQRQRQRDLLSRCQRQLAEKAIHILRLHQEKPSVREGIERLFRIHHTSESIDMSQYIIDLWLGIYIDLVILEKRVRGELLASEGILVVRERK